MDVADYFSILRRRWLVFVVGILVGVAGALSLTRSTPETYRASARLFVNVPAARGVQEALQGVQLTSGLLRSYAQVATSRAAAQRVIDELELDATAGAVSRKLSAVPQDDTLLITISADDGDPAEATRLANATADVFIELVDEFEAGRSEKIEARIIDAATEPSTPTAPKPRRNLALGVLAGIGLAVAGAFVLEALDRAVHTAEQASSTVGAPLLTVVPKRRKGGELVTLDDQADVAGEAYRSLRTNIRFLGAEQATRSIVVTSPSAGEGKTTTAANLAVAFAQAGARVVLVDADLRRGRLAATFDVDGSIGVTSVLTKQATLQEALQECAPNLSVLPAGPVPPNPAELVGSSAMARLIAELDDPTTADVVIIDAPPVLAVTDAVALSTQAQAVLVVVRAGRTRRDAAAEAARRLEVVDAEVIGCVLNAVPRGGAVQYQQEYRYRRLS